MPLNLNRNPGRTTAIVAGSVFLADQLTKLVVLNQLGYAQEKILIDGFFKFVHWGNTGAAWSMFHGKNEMLAVISLLALVALFFFRKHFEVPHRASPWAMGLLYGGILGNVFDRLHPNRGHVIDFIYFYTYKRNGNEIGFPAFNIADSAICTGVGLLMLLSWIQESGKQVKPEPQPQE